MSASVVASTFDQSIFVASLAEMVAIALRFARIGFTERDDADGAFALHEGREEDAAFDFAERAEADFAIVFSLIFSLLSSHFEPDAVELSCRGCKRQSHSRARRVRGIAIV